MKKLVVFSIILIFAGCATSEKVSRLHKGMTEEQVMEIMGHPDDIKTKGEYKAFRYSRKMGGEWASDKPAYHVIFKDGKLVENGAGTVRLKDKDGNVIMFVPY
jgi:outer membrane protein assembly factor BamE (lipoprotein component of BamABCDE complex)